MHIITCIKSVIMEPPEDDIVRSEELCELNPYDRAVLEMAIGVRDEQGGTVTALSMGPDASRFGLLEALAMGVDQAVLACDPALAGSDTLATSTALCAAIKRLSPFDLVLFGTRTADSDTGQVGPQTAVLLNIPMVTRVHFWVYEKDGMHVKRRIDGFIEKIDVTLPAGLTIDSSAVQARDIALSGIQGAFDEGRVEVWTLKELRLTPDTVGDKGSATRVLSMSRVPQGRTCEFIQGELREQADALIHRLSESGLIE